MYHEHSWLLPFTYTILGGEDEGKARSCHIVTICLTMVSCSSQLRFTRYTIQSYLAAKTNAIAYEHYWRQVQINTGQHRSEASAHSGNATIVNVLNP